MSFNTFKDNLLLFNKFAVDKHSYSKTMLNPIKKSCAFFITILYLTSILVYSQEATIGLGKTNIALNEVFNITITLSNEQIKTYSNFPDIKGMQKRGISSQSSTNIINGQVSFTQSIVQNYTANKEGKYKLLPFAMDINGKKAQSQGGVINIGPPLQQQAANDPFADFFGNSSGGSNDFVDVKDDAFFALTTNKEKVYVGEGFTATLAFYVAESNRAELQFYEIGKQMQDIVKKIKPSNCWEENFGIEEIQPEQILINGKRYAEYKLYRATYYPLNKRSVKFPAIPIKMIKFKVAKNPSFFGQNKQQDFKEFNTKAKIISVKELPPHPLRDNVSVGIFELEETISNKKVNTGKSHNYNFKIVGEGNISSIRNPQVVENKMFDIYPPNTFQNINRSGTAVTGTKNFNFFLVPKEPGNYKLGEYIFWVYFNPVKAKYDTLKSKTIFKVKGESTKNTLVSSNDLNDFMELINDYDNKIVDQNRTNYIKTASNILLIFMLIVLLGILIKKKKRIKL